MSKTDETFDPLTVLPSRPGAVLPIELFAVWLAAGERGLSSEAIVQRLTGIKVNTGRHEGAVEHPHDPSDFRRCVELLKVVPLARTYLPLMADVSPQWARIVADWDDLERLLAEESQRPDGRAPRLYHRLKQLERDARERGRMSGTVEHGRLKATEVATHG